MPSNINEDEDVKSDDDAINDNEDNAFPVLSGKSCGNINCIQAESNQVSTNHMLTPPFKQRLGVRKMYDVATIISILSMILSIGNTIYIWFWQSRVHLSLTVGVRRVFNAAAVETEDRILRWQIVNKSAFAVYLEEIGFCDYHKADFVPVPYQLVHKLRSDGAKIEYPYRLDSREGVILVVSHSSQTEEMRKHSRMYVKTCCGYLTSALIPSSTFIGIVT